MGEEEMRILLLLFGASCADDSTVIHTMDPTNEPCAPDTWTDKDGDGCAYWNVKYFQQGLTYGDCKNQNMVEKWLKDGFHPGFCEAMGCCDCTLSENCANWIDFFQSGSDDYDCEHEDVLSVAGSD